MATLREQPGGPARVDPARTQLVEAARLHLAVTRSLSFSLYVN